MIARVFWRVRRWLAPFVCWLFDHREGYAFWVCGRCDRRDLDIHYFTIQRKARRW